jgi:type IV pilus assembly protein PilY1
MNLKTLLGLLAAIVAVGAPLRAGAQTNISENFGNATTNNSWWYFNGACLTASTLTGQEPTVSGGVGSGGQIPGCTTIATSYYDKTSGEHLVGGITLTNSTPDPSGQGALRFTNGYPYGYDENGGIVFATPFPTGQGVSVTFKTVTYLGNSGGSLVNGNGDDGADGMSFFLMDASQLNTTSITGTSSGNGNGLGSWGGSLGYTCSNTNSPYNGLIGGYVGMGIDEYGNFLNGVTNTLGESGTTAGGDNTASGGGYQPGRIGLRGAGSIAWSWLNANYPTVYPSTFSAAQQNTAVQETCESGVLWDAINNRAVNASDQAVTGSNQVALLDYTALPGGYVVLPSTTKIANESATLRSSATPIIYQLKISENGLLSLSYAICPTAGCGSWISVIKGANITTSNGPLPANFLFGFAGSTGGSSNIHEILCFEAEPATSASSSAGASQKESAALQTGTQVYFAYYNPSNGWTGRLTASSLSYDAYGNIIIAATPNWDASCVLTGVASGSTCSTTNVPGPTAAEGPTARSILSWSGTAGVPFEWANMNATQQAALTAGDTSGTPALSSQSCPNGGSPVAYATQDRLNFLRGDRTCEINSSGTGLFRRRTSVLADIVDSSPTWIGAPYLPYPLTWIDKINSNDPLPENSAGSSNTYPAFETAQANREQVVYVGANDGLLHGFRSGTYNTSTGTYTNNDGLEVLAYMPGAIVQNALAATPGVQEIHSSTNTQVDYSNPQYGHDFWVDATPGTGDLFFGGAWHTWLVGGLGPGGAAIYALDVTNPSTFGESNATSLVVGEWNSSTISCVGNSGCGTSLGNTYGTPQIRRMHDGNWAIIFGNGLGSATGDGGIFVGVLDGSAGPNGAPTPKFYYLSTHTGSATNPNGIAYVAPADLDGDHIIDYVYAGDIQGNVWRFDLTSATESSWAVTAGPLFKSPTGQPITTTPVVAAGSASPGMEQQVMVLFGTGQQFPLTNATAATYATGTQSIYGVWDWNMAEWNSLSTTTQYASMAGSATGLGGNYTLTQSNLQAQTVTVNATTQDRDIAVNATICWAGQSGCTGSSAQFGWYLNLPGTQEQIIYNPELVDQALTVNSFVPSPNNPSLCTQQNPQGFTYVLSAMTGGAFNEVFLPPSESQNPGVNTNQAYTDPHAIAMLTNATGSSFIIANSSGEQTLIYETNQENTNGTSQMGGTITTNLPSNSTGRRLSWTQLR